MSYILDALQRAQAQRDQGAVPGLHTPVLAQPAPDSQRQRRLRVGALLAVCAALLALGVWLWPTPAVAPPAATPMALPAQSPDANTAPQPVGPTLSAPPTPVAPPTQNTATLSPRTPRLVPAATPTSTPASSAQMPRPPVAPAAKEPTVAPPTQAATPLPTLAELPEAIRAQIPALKITGAVQAQNPRNSLLLVNGQVLSPGAELAPGLVLESVDAHSAVLRLNGTRFRVGY